MLGCLIFTPCAAQADENAGGAFEQKIKAGLVYNFLKYTVWPQMENTPDRGKLNVCLFGGDPFDGYLSPLEGRTAQQELIVILKLKHIEQTEVCSLIFVHKSQVGRVPDLLAFLKGKPALTVSDIPDFAQEGGMVEMAKEDEKINLYINKGAVDHAGLDIQKRMLRLAKLVSR